MFRLDITPEQAAELASQLAALVRTNLAHPSIVAPFDAGVEGTVAYLAQDYVAADSLDAAIRQYGPAPAAQAVRILAAAAGAIDFAAAVGVYHGSLHPRDVLVTPDDTHITGVGIGRALEAVGLRGPMRRPYVAPERVQREGWDARADVHSVGVLARELLTGRPKAEADAESRLLDEQAERLKPVLARATAARPADRFPNCLELIGAVQDALAGGARSAARHAAAKPKQPTHDLLLPLDGEDDATVPSGGRLRLDEAAAGPDPGTQVERAPLLPVASMPIPDLDLHARAAVTEHPADAFDLSDLDSQLAVESESPAHDLPVEHATVDAIPEAVAFGGADSFSIAGPRTAELGPAIEVPPTDLDEDETEEFAGPSPRVEQAVEQVAPQRPAPVIAMPPPVIEEPAAAAPMRRPEMASPPPTRSSGAGRLYTAVLIVGIVLGAFAGYFVGSWRATARLIPATGPVASAPSAQTASMSAPPSQAPQAPTTAPETPKPVLTAAAPAATAATGRAARTPAAAVNGSITVQSTPRGVGVLINRRWRGRTPLSIKNLKFGRYSVRVAQPGYIAENRTVVLSAEQPTSTLDFTLSAAGSAQPASPAGFFGTLSVESNPSGARVFLDGKLLGTTPLPPTRVAAGEHALRIDRTGFRPWTEAIRIVTGQTIRKTASLEREPR